MSSGLAMANRGQNLSNSWSQPTEHSISPANVKGLTRNGCSQRVGCVCYSTVDGDAVYFPDWGGNLFAVRRTAAGLSGRNKISDYDGVDGAISRVSPAVDGNQVIIGDILNGKQGAQRRERDLRRSGIRNTPVDDKGGQSPAAIINWISGCFDGVVYVESLRAKKSGN